MAKFIESEATCKDCFHYKVCGSFGFVLDPLHGGRVCDDFINAVDVVEVVRCKECRMFVDNKSALTTYCTRECKNLTVKPDDFCSYGERRKEDG